MQRDRIRACILAAFTASLLVAAVAVLADLDPDPAGARATDPTFTASVGSNPTGQAMAQGFTGVSLEYGALHFYTGRDPDNINPVFLNLLRNLAPGGQTSVLRIGGNSADKTWWPMRGADPAGRDQLRAQQRLDAHHARAREVARREHDHGRQPRRRPAGGGRRRGARDARRARPRSIQAFEIGNEPDVYGMFPWYRDRRGRVFFARGRNYNLNRYIKQFSQWRAAMPSLPVTGPGVRRADLAQWAAEVHERRAGASRC